MGMVKVVTVTCNFVQGMVHFSPTVQQTCMKSGMVVAANSAKLGLALGICTSYGCGIEKHFCAAPFKGMVKVVAHTLVFKMYNEYQMLITPHSNVLCN